MPISKCFPGWKRFQIYDISLLEIRYGNNEIFMTTNFISIHCFIL